MQLEIINPESTLVNDVVAHRVAFSIGSNFNIYWYGIIFVCGFLIAILTYSLRLKFHYKVPYDPGFYYIFLAIPMTIIGARLWSLAIGDAKDFFDFRSGGLAIQGGVIAGVLSAAVYFPLILRIPKYHIRDIDADGNVVIRQPSMWIYADAIIPTILIGQALGRWGNFINGEIFGAESTVNDLQWLKKAMPAVFEGMKHYFIEGNKTLFTIYQPLFLYESFFNVIVFVFIYFGLSYIKQLKIGFISMSYFFFYGVTRFSTESARAPQFSFEGTYIINSLLLIFGVLGALYVQFIAPLLRKKFLLDAIIEMFYKKKDQIHKFGELRKPEEFLFYCHK